MQNNTTVTQLIMNSRNRTDQRV